MKPQQQAPQIGFTVVAASTRDDLHDHGFGNGERTFVSDEFRETSIDRAVRCPVVFHPGRRIGKDHELGGPESAGTLSIARMPRMARASSRVIGCPARWRRARSTASVLVRRW